MATHKINGYGRVKAVLSGDSVVLIGALASAPTGPSPEFPEKQLSLTGVTAPRFSRSKNQKDEPFAYEAREFLRKLCIGKVVSFYATGGGEDGAPGRGEARGEQARITHTLRTKIPRQ